MNREYAKVFLADLYSGIKESEYSTHVEEELLDSIPLTRKEMFIAYIKTQHDEEAIGKYAEWGR